MSSALGAKRASEDRPRKKVGCCHADVRCGRSKLTFSGRRRKRSIGRPGAICAGNAGNLPGLASSLARSSGNWPRRTAMTCWLAAIWASSGATPACKVAKYRSARADLKRDENDLGRALGNDVADLKEGNVQFIGDPSCVASLRVIEPVLGYFDIFPQHRALTLKCSHVEVGARDVRGDCHHYPISRSPLQARARIFQRCRLPRQRRSRLIH
jgi:hypothetical protein